MLTGLMCSTSKRVSLGKRTVGIKSVTGKIIIARGPQGSTIVTTFNTTTTTLKTDTSPPPEYIHRHLEDGDLP